METKFIRVLVSLGVPGVALGIFYLLLRSFNFQFSQITPGFTAGIATIFLLVVGGITFYTLHLWAPNKTSAPPPPARESKKGEIVFQGGEETVHFEELLRSSQHDVVKIEAHTHQLGIAAEYEWVRRRYPEGRMMQQALTTLELITGKGKYKSDQLHFDVLTIRLPDGRQKEIYFDISSFFGGEGSSLLDPQALIAKKITQLYENR